MHIYGGIKVFCNLFAYCEGVNVPHTQNQAHDDRFSNGVSVNGNGVLTPYINKEWGKIQLAKIIWWR